MHPMASQELMEERAESFTQQDGQRQTANMPHEEMEKQVWKDGSMDLGNYHLPNDSEPSVTPDPQDPSPTSGLWEQHSHGIPTCRQANTLT